MITSLTKENKKGILALKEEYEKVKESGKKQKILNMIWELNEQGRELVQQSNEYDRKRQYHFSRKAYNEYSEIQKIIKNLEVLLK